MSIKTFTPFGYRYAGNQAYIKLRFTRDKFFSLGIEQVGKHFTSKTGHIIFEAELDTTSLEYKNLMKKLSTPSE